MRIVDKPDGSQLRTESTFFQYIEQKDTNFYRDLELKISKWCLAIHMKKPVAEDIRTFVRNEFKLFFGISDITSLDQFLAGNEVQNTCTPSVGSKTNIYTHIRGGVSIDIEMSTIHGVKGQTHTATLYLETFYRDYDVSRIMKYLEGTHTPADQKRVQSNLRVSYVGMSRPSHFLCVAVHEAHLTNHSDKLTAAGWQIDTNLC